MKPKPLAEHLRVDRYGSFHLTDAIRPALDLPVVPEEGYRIEEYRERKSLFQIPVLTASVSREKLFDVFLTLLEPLGPTVDVVLETSHETGDSRHQDLLREQIDMPVLASHLCDFEDLLLNDGCTGIAVISTTGPMEVQFDEHKLLMVYAEDLEPFEEILLQAGLIRKDDMRLLTEAEHLHSTEEGHRENFDLLCCRVGVAPQGETVRW